MDPLEYKRMEIAQEAHAAAQARLDAAEIVLAAESGELDDDVTPESVELAAEQLCAPYCGCATCIIREVLDAAAPHMYHLAALQIYPN